MGNQHKYINIKKTSFELVQGEKKNFEISIWILNFNMLIRNIEPIEISIEIFHREKIKLIWLLIGNTYFIH